MRTDIQSLRALAVGLVVLNHLWPGRLGGGYVGVDVFFVISGFLITSHLMKEVEGTDRLGFLRFYARRARRLIPAATLVLVASAVAAYVVLPFPAWERTAWETISSALYVENWYLAARSVDYMALNDQATVAQHYWSLSVEEQFYLVWPALLVGVWALGRRRRGAVVGAILAVGLVSFVLGEIAVRSGSPSAYFVTHGRVWEFAVGALVALLASRRRLPARFAGAVAGAGFGAVVMAAFVYDEGTAFPGVTALLPVLGTAAVIWAGTGHDRSWHDLVTANPVVQWIGGLSYSLYLWHWPLIILVPAALGRPRGLVMSLGILALSLLLADLTRRFVEDRFRSHGSWARSTRRSLAGAAGLMAVTVLAGAGLVAAHAQEDAANQPPRIAQVEPCLGPNALADPETCDDPFGPVTTPTPGALSEYFATPDECGEMTDEFKQGSSLTTRHCDFSGGDASAPEVWLIGDSHAQQWQGLVLDLGRERGWDVTLSYLGGCPITDVDYVGFRSIATDDDAARCDAWSADVRAGVLQQKPDLVFTSSAARLETIDDGTGRPQVDQMTDALARVWTEWREAGVTVVPIADPPFNGEVRDPACVEQNQESPVECAVDRAAAQPVDPTVLAADRVDGVEALDLSDYFCDDRRCYAVIGGLTVYYDADHLSLAYVRQFRGIVDERLPASV